MGDDGVEIVEDGFAPDGDQVCRHDDASAGPMQRAIRMKLNDALSPTHLEIVNESFKHMGGCVDKETHFRISLVSEKFSGVKPLDRHKLVNAALKEELAGTLHALSIDAKAPRKDWSKK